jgi:hypothetical protein
MATNKAMYIEGPWTVGPRGASVYGPDNMRIASLDARAETLGKRTDTARLIAAAPDLLAALENMLERFGRADWDSVHDAAAVKFAEEAIAKAKGETP